MTRMAQTLMHLNNINWLVIQDDDKLNPLIEDLLQRTGIHHTYTAIKKTQEEINKKVSDLK
jgi:molybdopterin biosynthesis enzyme MoaB